MRHLSIMLSLFISLSLLSSCTMNEGGVRVTNNMETYAVEYINANDLLDTDEEILAYYDYTISLDGTEAAILTDKRVMYHNAETTTSSIALEDIKDVEHSWIKLVGDIIEVYSNDGKTIVIEIAPLNGGEIFINAIENKLESMEE